MKTYRLLFIGNFLESAQSAASVSKELSQHLRQKGYEVYTASKYSNRPLRLADMLTQALLHAPKLHAAVLDMFSGSAFKWAAMLGHLLFWLDVPFMFILRGGNLPEYAEKRPAAVRKTLQMAKFVISPSAYLQNKLSKYCGKIQVIHNPIPINNYQFRQRNIATPRMLWLRSLHEIYNPQMALAVINNLKKNFPNTQLKIVGPDKKDGTLENIRGMINKLEIGGYVQIAGHVNKKDIPATMQEYDVFLNTTNIDNTPISVIEAMACGLCVVSTNVGGIPYLLEDEKDALLVPPNDSDAMTAAVQRILTEPGLAEKLSINARKKAEQFDWSVVLPKWEELFVEMLSK